nr:prolyl 4-hydroxylase 1 isoform X2 [Ipomoea batatas]
MATAMRIVLGLLTFVTLGMIIGISHLAYDKEAVILRLGYECDYLRGIAKPRLKVSTVVDAKTGKGMKSDVRTSSGTFLSPDERQSKNAYLFISQVPVPKWGAHSSFKKHRYQKSELYRPHHDYFADQAGSNECSCGGETVKGLCVKPTKGNAVLFWSMGLDGESDPKSLHGGCEVLSGEKWSATKWMRERAIS